MKKTAKNQSMTMCIKQAEEIKLWKKEEKIYSKRKCEMYERENEEKEKSAKKKKNNMAISNEVKNEEEENK